MASAPVKRVPPQRDYSHEAMWSTIRPKISKQPFPLHKLRAIRNSFLYGPVAMGEWSPEVSDVRVIRRRR